MKKAVVVYSGGMDSFTLLNYVISKGYEVSALSFDYGQRHNKELEIASHFCTKEYINHQIIDISNIKTLLKGSALTDKISIPHGHYQDKKMEVTVVPNRNMIFLSLAIAYAISLNINKIYLGIHSGDYEIYYDCRPNFITKINEISKLIHKELVKVEVPFIDLDKEKILSKGIELGLDYSLTWSCYEGGDKSCGKCGACVERLEAFKNNSKQDPLEYQ